MSEPDLVFVTQDTEFEELPVGTEAKVIISRVPQRLPIKRRVEIWFEALHRFLTVPPDGHLFDLFADARVVGWESRRLK